MGWIAIICLGFFWGWGCWIRFCLIAWLILFVCLTLDAMVYICLFRFLVWMYWFVYLSFVFTWLFVLLWCCCLQVCDYFDLYLFVYQDFTYWGLVVLNICVVNCCVIEDVGLYTVLLFIMCLGFGFITMVFWFAIYVWFWILRFWVWFVRCLFSLCIFVFDLYCTDLMVVLLDWSVCCVMFLFVCCCRLGICRFWLGLNLELFWWVVFRFVFRWFGFWVLNVVVGFYWWLCFWIWCCCVEVWCWVCLWFLALDLRVWFCLELLMYDLGLCILCVWVIECDLFVGVCAFVVIWVLVEWFSLIVFRWTRFAFVWFYICFVVAGFVLVCLFLSYVWFELGFVWLI